MNSEIKSLGTVTQLMALNLNSENTQKIQKSLNLHFFNDENCNEVNENGYFLAKYPEIEAQNPQIKELSCKLNSSFLFMVSLEFFSDGSHKAKILD